jgi:hypothetical protein
MLTSLEIDQKFFVVGDCRYLTHPETGEKVAARITSILPTIVEGEYIVNYQPLNSYKSEFYTHHSINNG